jgi:hypothetical protein
MGILYPVEGKASTGMGCPHAPQSPTAPCDLRRSRFDLTGRRLPPDVSESDGRAFANLGIEHAPTSGMAGGDEPMQDQDRDRAVDQGRDSRGVFTGKQRPGGPWRR